MYDYELLSALVEITRCTEATKILNKFGEQLKCSRLMDLDLLVEDGNLKYPKITLGNYRMDIKYSGDKCTLEVEKIIKKVLCELFHLKEGSIIFRGAQQQENFISFAYEISDAVKSYLLRHQVTNHDAIILSKSHIAHVMVDDKDLMVPLHKVHTACLCIFLQHIVCDQESSLNMIMDIQFTKQI